MHEFESAQVDKDLRQMLLKPDAPPPKTIGVRVWPKAIPQFNVAHLETVQARPPYCQNLASNQWYAATQI